MSPGHIPSGLYHGPGGLERRLEEARPAVQDGPPLAGRFRQSIFGKVENWWNGGGLDSVHSSVVAPSPQ